jgi:hypothetical protein
MMQDWADRLDLCEQGKVDAATRQLTIYLDGVALDNEARPSRYVSMSPSRSSAFNDVRR